MVFIVFWLDPRFVQSSLVPNSNDDFKAVLKTIDVRQINVQLLPNEFIILYDQWNPIALKYLTIILLLLLIVEIITISLIFGILSYLKKHASNFSKSTFRLHVQFLVLLGCQVNILFCQIKSINI